MRGAPRLCALLRRFRFGDSPDPEKLVEQEEGSDQQVDEILKEGGRGLLISGVADGLEDPAQGEGGETGTPVSDSASRQVQCRGLDEHRQSERNIETQFKEEDRGDHGLGRAPESQGARGGQAKREKQRQDSKHDQRDSEGVAHQIPARSVVKGVVNQERVDCSHKASPDANCSVVGRTTVWLFTRSGPCPAVSRRIGERLFSSRFRLLSTQDPTANGETKSAAGLVAAIVFLSALVARIANLGSAFVGGVPQFEPFDDLYHAKRILYSARNLGRVSDLDDRRGPHGSFCPWPPLYDGVAGAAARLLGGVSTKGILSRVAWFPPVTGSVFGGLVAGWIAWRFRSFAGFVGGVGIALSPRFLQVSRLGAIDHHFLEPPLLLGIIGALVWVQGARAARAVAGRGALLGLALILALFVQPALLVAAGLVLLAVLSFDRAASVPRLAACVGFGLAAMAIFVYRLLQPSGYPDSEWYLGFPHAAVLFGASAASAFSAWMLWRGFSRGSAFVGALFIGGLVLAASPSFPSLLSGARFLGADRWLRQISEFRPLFLDPESWFLGDLCLLGGGSLLLAPFALTAWRFQRSARLILALFSGAYLLLACTSNRFLVIAGPLLAIVGAIVLGDFQRAGRRGPAVFATAVLLGPTLLFSLPQVWRPSPTVPPEAAPMIRAANAIRAGRAPAGRILAPWTWGHLFEILAERPVIVDGFGPSIGREDFENALRIVLARREEVVATYCRHTGIRFLVLENPFVDVGARAEILGISSAAFLRADGRGSLSPTRWLTQTFFWKAYQAGRNVTLGAGKVPSPFGFFRLFYSDPVRTADPWPFSGPAVEVWELTDINP